jgi:eukaryotic-like serine/threonine-protein kinase
VHLSIRPMLVLATLGLALSAPLLVAGSGASFAGRDARSAALCPSDMVWVPAGPFAAGATGEDVGLPSYEPDIPRDPRPRGAFETDHYCIDRYEWPGRGQRPLADVTWLQARAACEAVGKRLCSEDEWSKACGGVAGWLLPYGDLRVVGLCHADVQEEGSYDSVVPAGSTPTCRSPYGTLDQEGNLSEWVEEVAPDGVHRYVLGGTMWPGVYGSGCQARHGHPEVAPVAGDDGFRCCREVGL